MVVQCNKKQLVYLICGRIILKILIPSTPVTLHYGDNIFMHVGSSTQWITIARQLPTLSSKMGHRAYV